MEYSRIDSESDEFLIEKEHPSFPRRSFLLICSVLLLSVGLIAGFAFGVLVSNQESYYPRTNLIAPIGSKTVVLQYNQTFSLEPSTISNEAWDSILPRKASALATDLGDIFSNPTWNLATGKGFVQHPVLAPNVSSLSVFHQLHCLNSIRRGYYYALDPTILSGGSDLSRPSHIRHCLDFLRQNIMCAADTNFEPIDDELGGILGYGRPKVCRDYQNVKDWAEEWSASPDFRGMQS